MFFMFNINLLIYLIVISYVILFNFSPVNCQTNGRLNQVLMASIGSFPATIFTLATLRRVIRMQREINRPIIIYERGKNYIIIWNLLVRYSLTEITDIYWYLLILTDIYWYLLILTDRRPRARGKFFYLSEVQQNSNQVPFQLNSLQSNAIPIIQNGGGGDGGDENQDSSIEMRRYGQYYGGYFYGWSCWWQN